MVGWQGETLWKKHWIGELALPYTSRQFYHKSASILLLWGEKSVLNQASKKRKGGLWGFD